MDRSGRGGASKIEGAGFWRLGGSDR